MAHQGLRWLSGAKKALFLNRLVGIICERVKVRVFTTVFLEHYRTLFPRDAKKKMPWTLSAIGCASCIAKWSHGKTTEDIPFIFESGGEGWGLAHENYKRLVKLGRFGDTRIGTWVEQEKRRPGLQAADVWAWELRRFFARQLAGEHRPRRPSLDRLIHGVAEGMGYVLDGPQLLVNDLRNRTSTMRPFPFNDRQFPELISVSGN